MLSFRGGSANAQAQIKYLQQELSALEARFELTKDQQGETAGEGPQNPLEGLDWVSIHETRPAHPGPMKARLIKLPQTGFQNKQLSALSYSDVLHLKFRLHQQLDRAKLWMIHYTTWQFFVDCLLTTKHGDIIGQLT